MARRAMLAVTMENPNFFYLTCNSCFDWFLLGSFNFKFYCARRKVSRSRLEAGSFSQVRFSTSNYDAKFLSFPHSKV